MPGPESCPLPVAEGLALPNCGAHLPGVAVGLPGLVRDGELRLV